MTGPYPPQWEPQWQQPPPPPPVEPPLNTAAVALSSSGSSADHQLDLAGVASFLANGAPLGGRTIHRGVAAPTAERAQYTGDLSGTDERELEDQLFDLVVAAVGRRLPDGPLWLSLSAGYDARGLLGVLRHIGAENVRCFSYAYGHPLPGSDAFIAADLARSCGYEHELVPSYQGDLIATISVNAEWGQGATNFCDEADAWQALSGRNIADLMVGDEALGWIDWPLRTTDDVLDSVSIGGALRLRSLKRHAPEAHRALSPALATVVEELKARVRAVSDLHDQKDTLYVEQRLQHVLLPWRERFAGRAAPIVHNPFLDPEVLAFIQRLPAGMRLDKRLYRKAVRRRLPEMFKLPIAATSGYVPDWTAELERHAGAIEKRLEQPSRLDGLVPVNSVRAVLKAALPSVGRSGLVRCAVRRRGGDGFQGSCWSWHRRQVPPSRRSLLTADWAWRLIAV